MDWVDDFVDYILTNYSGKVAEIGIGRFTGIAEKLSEFLEVVAVDIQPVSSKIKILKDDVTSPDLEIYRDVSLIYSIRPPPELYRFIISLAEKLGVDAIIKPFGTEVPEGMKLVNHGKARFYLWKRDVVRR